MLCTCADSGTKAASLLFTEAGAFSVNDNTVSRSEQTPTELSPGTLLLCSQKRLQEGNVWLCIVLSHLSNTVYLSRITYMCSNCLYRTRLFLVKFLVGKQLLIEKTTFCGLLKWFSKIRLMFHCSEIWVWKIERFLNWWWSTFGYMFNCSAEFFMSGK